MWRESLCRQGILDTLSDFLNFLKVGDSQAAIPFAINRQELLSLITRRCLMQPPLP
jgi:hypothetical protein